MHDWTRETEYLAAWKAVEAELRRAIHQGPLAPAGNRVVVAMSGGVDSSVAAALLVTAGFEVIGITLQLWPDWLPPDHEGGCCSLGAVEDARRVATRLGIPYYVINMGEAFEEAVIRPFARAYLAGRTPNPCLICNRDIKFGALLEKARQLGADYVASGHYARVMYDPRRERYMLRQGFDQRKDQSYALYQLAQDQLAHTLTPLGVLDKAVTRAIATRLGLVTARKPESQEICFVPDNDYRRFLREYTGLKENPGPIVDREGRVLGTHKGVAFYTVGQRHGLGLSGSQPYYVLEVDAEANRLVVGGREEGLREKLLATEVNLISRTAVPAAGLKVEAKIRYRVPQAGAEIIPHPTDPALVWTRFASPQWAVTPGQSVVWYEKDDDGAGADRYDVVVGGGVIATRARERASQEAEAVGPSARR